MAWEDRNGRRYYYRKRRKGGRVVSEYVGSGLAGQTAEAFDTENKQEAAYRRAAFQEQKASVARIDSQAGEIEKYTQAITRACLLLAGYHAHKRQWRKIKNV